MNAEELVLACALAAAGTPIDEAELVARVSAAAPPERVSASLSSLLARGWARAERGAVELTSRGAAALLDAYGDIEAALDPSHCGRDAEECPTLPWITQVETEWIDALSINWSVDEAALAALLPAPLVPEAHRGRAWVQILISSLRDLRPQGLPSPFGVCFYQVSYRAAVKWRGPDGAWRRGGFFVRSETNNAVMRAIGNRLAEFKFHDFGAAEIVMVRDGARLTVGIDPTERPGGKLFATVDTTPLPGAPKGSVWSSLEDLHQPLVECYDALGVDRDQGWMYVLTIDREPWRARFVAPDELYCEYFDAGALGGGVARLDSVLHLERCRYRWRPLRRERLA